MIGARRIYTVAMNKFVFAFLGLLGGLSLCVADSRAAAPVNPVLSIPVPIWSEESIGPGGTLNDVAVDSAGNPHVLYVDMAAEELRYARRVDGAWVVTPLGPFPVGSPPPDMVLDLAIDPTNDEPVVAYSNIERNSLYVGRPNEGVWWFERLDDIGQLLSLRVDPAGDAHLVYVRGSRIAYTYQVGGVWHRETIGEPVDAMWNLSMDLDSAGFPHVAWSGSSGSFHAQRLGPNAWDITTLPASELRQVISLAVDPADRPHFLVMKVELGHGWPPYSRITLLLAEHTGGSWEFTPLWQAYDWGVDARLVAGADGSLHVAYYDSDARPHYDVVDPDGRLSHDQPFDRGQGQMRLAPGTDGRPFISHFDGHTLFLSRQGIALHDRLIFGPAALR